MVISHKYKFIYIAVPKTASTSIEHMLRDYGTLAGSAKHATAAMTREQYSQVWDEYFKFSFVRNPWDWLVSWYTYRKRDALKDPEHPNHRNYTGNMQFEEFLRHNYPAIRQTQRSRISGGNGQSLVDYVGRYENLNNEFIHICEKIGLPNPTLPHLFKSERHAYREYYTDTTRQLVVGYYQDDIDLFKYTF